MGFSLIKEPTYSALFCWRPGRATLSSTTTTMSRQWHGVKFSSDLSNSQPFCLWNKFHCKVQEERARSYKHEECIRLEKLKQMRKRKRYKPIRGPVDEYASEVSKCKKRVSLWVNKTIIQGVICAQDKRNLHCHGCISSIKRKYLCNDEPSYTTWSKSKENNHSSCGCYWNLM